MFIEGTVKSYNPERGFGFIQAAGQQQDIFFHIQDCPAKDIEPVIGEKMKFMLVEDGGKFKAGHIVRLDLTDQMSVASVPMPFESTRQNAEYGKVSSNSHNSSKLKLSKFITVIGLIVVVVLGILVYGKYQQYQEQKQIRLQQMIQEQEKLVVEQRKALGDLPERVIDVPEQERKYTSVASNQADYADSVSTDHSSGQSFKCDGRTHCSQMRSYDEAVFFLKNCPDVKMDGNNDGIPCERQFNR